MTLPAIDNITSLLSSFLDVQSRRAEVVAANLANADTPNYVAKEVEFADFLRNAATEAMTPTGAGASNGMVGALRIVEQQRTTIGLDGNSVDSAHEMSTLADAGMNYQEGAQLLQMRLRTLRTAIREGK